MQVLGWGNRGLLYQTNPLWRLQSPSWAGLPLIWESCPRWRDKLSVSKVSIRRQSLWSVTSAMERKLPLSFLSFSFSLSWPFHEPWGLLGGGLGREEKALLISSEPWELSNVSLLSLRVPLHVRKARGINPFPTRTCVLFQGLPVAPLLHTH